MKEKVIKETCNMKGNRSLLSNNIETSCNYLYNIARKVANVLKNNNNANIGVDFKVHIIN